MRHHRPQRGGYNIIDLHGDILISKAIDEDDYIKTLHTLSEKKLATLKGEKNIFIKKKKLQDYLLQKGYEYDIIKEIITQT